MDPPGDSARVCRMASRASKGHGSVGTLPRLTTPRAIFSLAVTHHGDLLLVFRHAEEAHYGTTHGTKPRNLPRSHSHVSEFALESRKPSLLVDFLPPPRGREEVTRNGAAPRLYSTVSCSEKRVATKFPKMLPHQFAESSPQVWKTLGWNAR